VTDEVIRQLERQADGGDPVAVERLLAEQRRRGLVKIQRFRSYPVGPSGETEEQREARLKATSESDLGESWWFWCAPCGTNHSYRTKLGKGETGPVWSFNGDPKNPTFTPSLLYRTKRPRDGKVNPDGSFDPIDWVCHLFLTNGQIAYCGDCTHDLRGKTVPLPDPS